MQPVTLVRLGIQIHLAHLGDPERVERGPESGPHAETGETQPTRFMARAGAAVLAEVEQDVGEPANDRKSSKCHGANR
jgi:hypothetical protein